MTIAEARRICRKYYELTNPTEDDDFLFTEAMKYLVDETKDPAYMMDLGGYYYWIRQFDLALKYYELADSCNYLPAVTGLGYIWYYGRTGEKNYEKAFRYFDKAYKMGDPIAAYKVADMYRNGYFVEKDYNRYKDIIEDLYPKIKDGRRLDDPVPEVFTRLAKIRSEEGKTEEALNLYDYARFFLAQRIRYNPFFGNLNIMKWMIEDIYKLREFDPDSFELYDLYFILRNPAKVRFFFEDRAYEVESVKEDGEPAVRFDGKWFRDVDDFFKKAEIDGELLTARYEELYGFEVDSWIL
ncbi:MAG: sel1 repeat family protein [Clostridia bacterium]|nr:sel1 repeat family protein [Clostridia bacterium]